MTLGSMDFEDGAFLVEEPPQFSTEREMAVPIPFGMGEGTAVMLCPIFGNDYTHVDTVQVLTASGRSLAVHATGEDEDSMCSAIPLDITAESRRHEIVLIGWCEDFHQFCIHFTQHKGLTETVVHRLADREES